jgi:multicomponent Na+:H+ antiporter subunit C
MNVLLAITAGVLFGGGLFMMLRRSLVRVLIGLLMISNAVNLIIFTAGRLVPARPPLISAGESALQPPYADPVPQALILTAIVISFGVTAFAIVLMQQTYRSLGNADMNEMRSTDTPVEDEEEGAS